MVVIGIAVFSAPGAISLGNGSLGALVLSREIPNGGPDGSESDISAFRLEEDPDMRLVNSSCEDEITGSDVCVGDPIALVGTSDDRSVGFVVSELTAVFSLLAELLQEKLRFWNGCTALTSLFTEEMLNPWHNGVPSPQSICNTYGP